MQLRRQQVVLTLALLAGCELEQGAAAPAAEDSSAARNAVIAAGYTDVKMGGHVSLLLSPCSEEDSWFTSYNFTAKTATGKHVSGHACCGLVFRGCTLRF